MSRDIMQDLTKLANAFFDNLQISDCEFGAIGVDCKRPFGSSNVEGDILEIIGWEMEDDDDDTAEEYARELYQENLIPFLKKEWNVHVIQMILGS